MWARGRAALSWHEAAGGVLCAGAAGYGTTTTSFQFAHAAIRRRKPVIAVDLSGNRQLAEWFAIVCGATGTPLSIFSAAGTGYYEPLRDGDPARRTAIVMGMIDWTGIADRYRRSCGAYLNDLFAVADAAPGDPGTPMLDELLHLLNPAALSARVQHVPGFHPHREALIERVKVSAGLFGADPATGAALASQLGELRTAPVGRWLAPVPPASEAAGAGIDLGRAIRQRGVVLFSLGGDAHSRPARMVASLVTHDAIAVCAELRKIGVAGDGVLWIDECGAIAPGVLAELVKRGAAADMAAVLTTTSAAAADNLADQVNAVVIHRMTDPVMAERFARITGVRLEPSENGAPVRPGFPPGEAARFGRPAPAARGAAPFASTTMATGSQSDGLAFVRKPMVAPEVLFSLGRAEFVMVVAGPPRRLVALGKTIPARLHAAPQRAVADARPRSRSRSHARSRGRSPVKPSVVVQTIPHQRQPLRSHFENPGRPDSPASQPLPPGRPAPHPLAPPPPRGPQPAQAPERRLWPM